MAIGRYVTDLDTGDVLGPVEYEISPFQVREYCHSVEMHQEYFQGTENQIAPPTLVHLEKLRLYRHACPAGTGPTARIHYEFDGDFHAFVPAGVPLRVTGTVADRSQKRGRDYVRMTIELRRAADGELLVTYRDTVILAFKQAEA
ncbi:hypothetical protein [Bosea sp. (in: a-proteobacteria)]|jgi:hypothetical protein|uniref:hypothetical protein n=1 Tax=Bosea sp. (in: a-proteobacteria) TaxID=1871050 RepID=UPI003F70EF97